MWVDIVLDQSNTTLYFIPHLQVARFDVYFNYKREHRNASIHSVVAIILSLLLITMTNLITHNLWEISSVLHVLDLVYSLLQNSMSLSVSISFTFLLRNLYRRYVALNSLLRYRFPLAHVFSHFIVNILLSFETETDFWAEIYWNFQLSFAKKIQSKPLNSLDVSIGLWLTSWISSIFVSHFRSNINQLHFP